MAYYSPQDEMKASITLSGQKRFNSEMFSSSSRERTESLDLISETVSYVSFSGL